MNPRIAKEVRVQLPVFAFIAATAVAMEAVHLAQAPFVIVNERNILTGVYFIGCIVMAAMVFGSEFQHRTLSLLVSQPMARKRIWQEKMLVLGLFSAVSFIAVVATMFLMHRTVEYIRGPGMPDEELFFLCFLLIMPILFSCTVPYLTLLSKSTIGGVVFAVFGAGMLLVAEDTIWNRLSQPASNDPSARHILWQLWGPSWLSWLPSGPEVIYAALFIPYAVIMYWLGRKRFLRMEMLDSRALEASLPAAFEAPFDGLSRFFSGAFSGLLFKEIRLQRISLMMTAMFCLAIALEAAAWKSRAITDVFYIHGSIMIYLLFFPAIVGVTAVAEEKTWGLKDWHQTLPPSLRTQWRAKWLVALMMTSALGAALAFGLIRICPALKDFSEIRFSALLVYCVSVTFAAMYAASVSTSSIRALLLTLGMIVTFAMVFSLEISRIESPGRPSFDVFDIFIAAFGGFYNGVLRLLWNLIVTPVWFLTHSVEKTSRVARWCDMSINNHLTTLLAIICLLGAFSLMLRFARTNYRYSDLMRSRILKQALIIIPLAVLMGMILLFSQYHTAFRLFSHGGVLSAN
jgi:ABC-type transport system involved in multi-copper enzyme maturation permease subunit